MRSLLGAKGRPWALTAAAVVLVLIGAGCHSGPSSPYAFPEESQLLVLPVLGPGALGVVAKEEYQPAGAGSAPIAGSPSSGLPRTLASLQGEPTYATASFASAPLPRDLYLDLDQPIAGQLFVGNTGSSAGRSSDSMRIITELYVDGQLAGGATYEHTAYSTGAAWNSVPVYFRPEVAKLPAGATLELRVSAQVHLLDLQIGHGQGRDSRLELAYYPYDPLAGAVFLEDGKLVSALSADNGTDSLQAALDFMASPAFDALPPGHYVVRGGQVEDAPEVGLLHPALILPLPLLLFGLAGRMPPRRWLGVATVAIVVLAGCADPASEDGQDADPDAPKPRVDSEFKDTEGEEAEKQREAQVGAIQGVVTNYFGLPVKAAHVSILATNKFTTSDEKGAFAIAQVPAGKYEMRVDAEGLDSLQRSIEVKVAKITKLNIVLIPPNGTRPDQIQHLHDEWRGQATRLLDEVTVQPDAYLYTQTVEGMGMCAYSYWDQGSHGTNAAGNQCTMKVPFDFEKRVLPGTSLVEVTLDWDDSGDNVKALGLMYSSGLRSTGTLNAHLPRGPGEPFLLHVFPNQADPGHQSFTNWQFHLFVPGSDAYAGPRDSPYPLSPVTVKATIQKGIIPFEPKHEDRWGDASRFTLADGTEREVWSSLYTPETSASVHQEADGWYSVESTSGTQMWAPLKGTWIPPGTAWIEGRLIDAPYSPGAGVTVPESPYAEYGLGYKPADVPLAQAHGNLKIVELTRGNGYWEFTIVPTDHEEDKWYQTASQWRFYLLARSDVYPYYYNYGYTLEAHAVKDPSFQFQETMD